MTYWRFEQSQPRGSRTGRGLPQGDVRGRRRLAAGVLAAAAALAGSGCGGSSPAPVATPPTVAGAQATATAGWALPTDASTAARAAGLVMLGEEQLKVHYHAHLDIVVDGQRVPVPAFIGIDLTRHLISPLHTHDASGVVHIESATDVPFTLGQVFTEWGQPLRADHVGPVTVAPGQELRVYRNGQRVAGDPGALRLRAHDEIVVWVGPTSEQPKVPSTYAFPPGL
jgi:hypothetical protein